MVGFQNVSVVSLVNAWVLRYSIMFLFTLRIHSVIPPPQQPALEAPRSLPTIRLETEYEGVNRVEAMVGCLCLSPDQLPYAWSITAHYAREVRSQPEFNPAKT